MDARRLPDERELLFQLRTEVDARYPAAVAAECSDKPIDLIRQELGALLRRRIAQWCERESGFSDEARAALIAMCNMESTRIGSLKTRINWAQTAFPCSLWVRPPRASLTSVPRVHTPSCTTLYEQFVSRNLPCIITGAFDAAGCPPLRSFKDDNHLRARAGQRRVPVKCYFQDAPADGRRVFTNDEDRRVPFAQYIDCLAAAGDGPPPMYLAKCDLRKSAPLTHSTTPTPPCWCVQTWQCEECSSRRPRDRSLGRADARVHHWAPPPLTLRPPPLEVNHPPD